MGRAKLVMKLMSDKRKRVATFNKRKKSLMKKVKEFTILCGVEACVVIYGPDAAFQPGIWPQDLTKVRDLMNKCKRAKAENPGRVNIYGMSDFYHYKAKKVKEALAKLQKEKFEAKLLIKQDMFDTLSPEVLMKYHGFLSRQLDLLKSNLETSKHKTKAKEFANYTGLTAVPGFQYPGLGQYHDVRNNSMMMVPMDNGNSNYVDYNNYPCTNEILNAIKQEALNDEMTLNAIPSATFYPPSGMPPQMASPYMHSYITHGMSHIQPQQLHTRSTFSFDNLDSGLNEFFANVSGRQGNFANSDGIQNNVANDRGLHEFFPSVRGHRGNSANFAGVCNNVANVGLGESSWGGCQSRSKVWGFK